MSEEQLSALLAKLKEDAGLREKLLGAADLDAAVAMAQEAGFEVSNADWVRYEAQQILELSDEELEGVVGANGVKSYFCDKRRDTDAIDSQFWCHPASLRPKVDPRCNHDK